MSELKGSIDDTDLCELGRICDEAKAIAPELEEIGRPIRALALRAIASALEEQRSEVVRTADAETSLGSERIGSELTRTQYQCRHFADVLDEGSYLEVTIDHSATTVMGVQPDLRRYLVPIGPVAVFGASNFPLAFSVPGGDTVAAIAAGCPVVAKAHPSHPLTSQLCADIMATALVNCGLPNSTLQLVVGYAAGQELVKHAAIKAVAFTGSLAGGKALLEAISKREDPIPFYGELSGINPVVVLPYAAKANGATIGHGVAASGTTSNGQLCTKPQLVYVPSGPDGDRLVDEMGAAFSSLRPQPFLNERISADFVSAVNRILSDPRVDSPASISTSDVELGRPTLLSTSCADTPPSALAEVFGPLQMVVRYASPDELIAALDSLPGSLTATIHAEPSDKDLATTIMKVLRDKAGRFIFNGYPTGVMVAWAQNHGGPWPASTSNHTSVGATSIRRFLRPVTYQSAPAWILPAELQGDHNVPARLDGTLSLP